jgi:hypothetical protein
MQLLIFISLKTGTLLCVITVGTDTPYSQTYNIITVGFLVNISCYIVFVYILVKMENRFFFYYVFRRKNKRTMTRILCYDTHFVYMKYI